MSQDFDAQLLESVAVRRRRLRGALLWGSLRTRRRAAENVTRFLVGVAVAAVLAAGQIRTPEVCAAQRGPGEVRSHQPDPI